MPATEIWIARAGSTCGPYTEQEMDKLVEDGLVYPDDLAWSAEAQAWVALAELFPQKAAWARAANPAPQPTRRREPLVDPSARRIPVRKHEETDFSNWEQAQQSSARFWNICGLVAVIAGVAGFLAIEDRTARRTVGGAVLGFIAYFYVLRKLRDH
jgi:hypothetical protein